MPSKTKTTVRAFAVFSVEQTIVTSETSDDRPTPEATSNQTAGVEPRDRLRPSRPVGPGLVSVREAGNVFSLRARRKVG
jgi:hypothetical protein